MHRVRWSCPVRHAGGGAGGPGRRAWGERAHVCAADLRGGRRGGWPDCGGGGGGGAGGHTGEQCRASRSDMLALRMKDEDWASVLDVDLGAPFRLCRAALRGMVKRRAGRIVQISSVVGHTGNPGQANYAAAKAGLAGMSRALAQEVGSRGITVNLVAPGFVETAMTVGLADAQKTPAGGGDTAGPDGAAGGCSGRRCVSGLGRSRVGDRDNGACEWRDGDAVTACHRSAMRADFEGALCGFAGHNRRAKRALTAAGSAPGTRSGAVCGLRLLYSFSRRSRVRHDE